MDGSTNTIDSLYQDLKWSCHWITRGVRFTLRLEENTEVIFQTLYFSYVDTKLADISLSYQLPFSVEQTVKISIGKVQLNTINDDLQPDTPIGELTYRF